MRKRHLVALVVCALALQSGAAAIGARGFPLRTTPAADSQFDVRAHGATGDGKTLDTDAINRAIDAAAAAGGGTVVFPAGTYLSTSIHLKSHVALFIGHGAVIEAAPLERAAYDEPEPNPWDKYQDFGHSHWHNSLMWGENVEDVAILGTGLIHGKGLTRAGNPPKGAGNKSIALKNSRNITIRDISILHGGHFAILATGVDNLTVDNVKMDTNRDGIDVDACRNVRLSNLTINSPFDDGICLKSSFGLGVARATENVTITNCQVSGYDVGTFLDGTLKRTLERAPDRSASRESLANLNVPVLFIGGEHDEVMPVQLMAVARTLIPGARMEVVPGAGHSVYFEAPETFNRLVLDFFASCAP